MYPLVEPRQRPERFLLNRFSPLAESAVFLGLGGFDAAGSVWYPDAQRLLGGVPNDGTLTNMDPATDWVWSPELGRLGCEVITSQYITMGDIAAFDGLTALTLCTWIKPSGIANNERILSKWVGEATQYTFLLCTQDTTRPAFVVYAQNVYFGKKATAADLVVGQSKHLAVTWVPGAIQIYVDGVEVAQSAWYSGTVNSLRATTADFRVGHSDVNAVDAVYADVAAYSRILSPGEISALADPSNVMLEVGGVPLILPPRRVAFPAAAAGGDITETASPVSSTWSVVAPSTSKSITSDAVSATFTAVTPSTAKSVAPAAVVATWSPITPATSKTLDVSPVSATWSVPTPTAGSSFIAVDVSPVTATWSPVAPATAKTITPDPVSATWTPAAPTTAKVLGVDPVALTWSIVAAELTKATTPDPVAATWLLPDITTAGGAGSVAFVDPVVATWTVAVARGGTKPVIDSANVLLVQSESRVLRVQSESRILQVQ